MSRTELDQLFANLRRPVFVEDANAVPQEIGARNGNITSQGWLEDESVSSDVIQADAVIASKISAGAVEAEKLAANSVTAGKIAAGAVETDKLAANAVTAAKIEAGTITSNEIAANTITGDNIAANTITASEIAANSITASEIAANAITTSELSADSVTTNKIVAANVTSSRMEVNITGKTYGASNGTVSSPGFYFDSASNTGLAFTSAGLIMLLTVGGTDQMAFTGLITSSNNLIRPSMDDTFALGDSTHRWSEVWATDGTINTSDATEKRDIEDSPLGLQFIERLRPVRYRWRDTVDTQAAEAAQRGLDEDALAEETAPWEKRIVDAQARMATLRGDHPDIPRLGFVVRTCQQRLNDIRSRHLGPLREAQRARRPGRRYHYGLVAQDVKEALDAEGQDAAFWKQSQSGLQSLSYSELFAPVIRGMQELAAENRALKQRLSALEDKA